MHTDLDEAEQDLLDVMAALAEAAPACDIYGSVSGPHLLLAALNELTGGSYWIFEVFVHRDSVCADTVALMKLRMKLEAAKGIPAPEIL